MLAPAPLFGHLPERRRHRGASHALIRDIAARSRQLGDDFSRRWVAETHTHTSCAVFDTADIVRRCRVFSVIATYSVRQRRKRVLTSDPTWPGCWTFWKSSALLRRILLLRMYMLLWKNFLNERSVCRWGVYDIFESHPVYDTMRDRKVKFLEKCRMLPNQLCMLFEDKATADLEIQ